MSVDEIVKLMIFIGITFSMIGVSFQIMRILGKFADMLGDLRKTIQNLGDLSTQMVDDYKMLSVAIRAISGGLTNINSGIIQPLSSFGKIFSKYAPFLSKNRNEDDEDEE